ncbi:MAG: hypothetical protein AVDCRST_MAG56-3833 [uncultured Cytophagales bacterium]|uniref:Uncharacterized protein n=1 Tax=uncultured Cytophagales bacterium TaxID=158755 RepID=A0A6J4JIZ0_9SPHI|nr:MAG: hypothetical protein AVDCRST_MAG56-3833 [uncultured Cytophagales bacterium]
MTPRGGRTGRETGFRAGRVLHKQGHFPEKTTKRGGWTAKKALTSKSGVGVCVNCIPSLP